MTSHVSPYSRTRPRTSTSARSGSGDHGLIGPCASGIGGEAASKGMRFQTVFGLPFSVSRVSLTTRS